MSSQPPPDQTRRGPADGPDPEEPHTTPSVGTRLSNREIHENVRQTADEELERPSRELAWSALEAGLLIGFSMLASAFLASLVAREHRTAAAAVGYPLGFVFVVLARSQLFTEHTLEPLVPLLERRDRATLRNLLRLWGVVLAGNLLGTLAFALAAAHTPLVDESLRPLVAEVSEHATSGGFALVFYKAIFGGWLIALMAWLVASTGSTGAQIALVWLTTAPISAFGFRHSIAGSVEAFYRAATGSASWGAMVGSFVVPAVLGNVIGGGVLVALLNHLQVPRSKRPGAGGRAR